MQIDGLVAVRVTVQTVPADAGQEADEVRNADPEHVFVLLPETITCELPESENPPPKRHWLVAVHQPQYELAVQELHVLAELHSELQGGLAQTA